MRRVHTYHPRTRVTVLIPEVEPAHIWQRVLQNQRGAVLAHAVRKDTDAVICRLRFRLGPPRRPPRGLTGHAADPAGLTHRRNITVVIPPAWLIVEPYSGMTNRGRTP